MLATPPERPESDTRPDTRTLFDTPEHQRRVAEQRADVEDARKLTRKLRELAEDARSRIDDRLARLDRG